MPNEQKVLFVAYDAGPSAALQKVVDVMGEKAHSFLLNAGKVPEPDEATLREAVARCDVVVSGLSSEKSAGFELRALALAVELGKKIVFFSDTFGAFHRAWFADYRSHVALVTTVVEAEVEAAQALFPNARVITTGNPAWEEFHTPYTRSNQEKFWRLIDARRTDRLILISGCKDRELNLEMVTGVLQDAEDVSAGNDYQVVLSLHPGDQTHVDEYWAVWQKAILDLGKFVILTRDQMPGDVAVGGADVVVTYNAASVAMRAVAHGQPVMVFQSPRAKARQLAESGLEINPLLPEAAIGVGHHGETNFASALLLAYYWKYDNPISNKPRIDQAKFFPSVLPGTYTNALIEAIKSL